MLEFLRRFFARQPAAAPAIPPPEPPPPPSNPVIRTELPELPTIRRVVRAHGNRLSVPAATALACRLLDIVSGSTTPLGGLNHDEVRFLPSGEAVIVAPYPYGAPGERGLRGSFWHLSPEQVRGLPLDARSDLFNIAVLLHEWIAGAPLFRAESDFTTLEAVRSAQLPPRPSAIPDALHRVLIRALAADPNRRFQTPSELRNALLPFADSFDPKSLLPRTVTVTPPEPPPTTPLTPGDEGERLVYADWLEEQGKSNEAAWLRQESALRSLEGAALDEALARLRDLSVKVGTEFMASVARPAVEGCSIRFGFKCPKQWDAMQRTEREEIRHCTGCGQDVHFCRTIEEAQALARQDACVALDPSLVRSEGDLDPTPAPGSYLGRLA